MKRESTLLEPVNFILQVESPKEEGSDPRKFNFSVQLISEVAVQDILNLK
jgi:hypothetical protein